MGQQSDNDKIKTLTNNDRDTLIVDVLSDETAVVEYLTSHPDFFQRHTDLLANLQVPHAAGTSSLIERQVAILREKNRDLNEQLQGLVRTARGNEQIVTRLHRFALELMRSDCVDDVIATCQDVLREDFNADFVTLKVITEDDTHKGMHFVKASNDKLSYFDKLFKAKYPVCGRGNAEQKTFLFDENNADNIQSVALVSLQNANKLGILALGSRDETRFHPGMGTVFIKHLGELVSTSLSHHLGKH